MLALSADGGVQADLLEPDLAVAAQVELAVGAVGGPAGLGEEAAQVVVTGVEPGDRGAEAVGDQGVDAGLHQPAGVTLAAPLGVDGQVADLAVGAGVEVRVDAGCGDANPVTVVRSRATSTR